MTTRRKGSALEFAILLPLLFSVAVVGWWAARGGFTRIAAASDARKDAWVKRDRADAGEPFDPKRTADAGFVDADVSRSVGMPSPINGTTASARSTSGSSDDPLDSRRIPFEELHGKLYPHPEPLVQAAKYDVLLARFAPRMKGFAALDPTRRPALMLAPEAAVVFRSLRSFANPIFEIAGPAFASASGVLAALAVRNPFKIPLYTEEIRVLTNGVEPSRRIPSEAVTK